MNQALFRYRDGRVDSGVLVTTLPVPSDLQTVSALIDGATRQIPLSELKAVFLLRPSELSPDESATTRVNVEFFDGENLRGRTAGASPARSAFLLYPDDGAKVEAVLVVTGAMIGLEVDSAGGNNATMQAD